MMLHPNGPGRCAPASERAKVYLDRRVGARPRLPRRGTRLLGDSPRARVRRL